MASAALNPDIIIAAAGGSIRDRLSAAILTDSATGGASWRSQVFLVKCRTQGFLALFPNPEIIPDCLHAFPVPPGSDSALLGKIEVPLESIRGRALGTAAGIIADVPWDYLVLFRKPKALSVLPLHSFKLDGTAARPSLNATIFAAEQWVQGMMDPETGNEYLSAEEMGSGLEAEPEEPAEVADPEQAASSEMEAMKARVALLEQMLRGSAGQPNTAGPADQGQKSLLFDRGQAPQQLTAADMVGPPPRRLGRTDACGPHGASRSSGDYAQCRAGARSH